MNHEEWKGKAKCWQTVMLSNWGWAVWTIRKEDGITPHEFYLGFAIQLEESATGMIP